MIRSKQESSAQRKWTLPVMIAFLVALCSVPVTFAQTPPPAPNYEIEIGDAVLVPGQAVVMVPVFMTNSVPVQSWGMGLDYDDFHIYCAAVTTVDTVSEPLSPVIGTIPSAPPLNYVQMMYSAGPLPVGVHQIVAYLICEVQAVPAATTTVDINPIETGINGTPATQIGGSVQVMVGNALGFGVAAGSLADQPTTTNITWPPASPAALSPLTPVRVPVYMWNTEPVSKITFLTPLGLDYDEFLMHYGVDVAGTVTAQVAGNNVAVGAARVGDALYATIDLGNATIPPSDGALVAWLSVLPQTPLAGVFDVQLSSSLFTVNGQDLPVMNLLDGQAEFLNLFIRGDVEFDRSVNLSDAASIAEIVFLAGEATCPDAADVNDDGSINVADLVQLLTYIFNSSPLPADPFPKAGADSTADPLPCL
ncbi:MAG: dockerin type I repeat-containing protein [Planctomycetota bacterium]